MPLALIPLLVLAPGAVFLLKVAHVKLRDQQKLDRERRTYVITFPSDVTFASVLAFIRALAGLQRMSRFGGLPTYIFEIEADQRGITHRLSVPRGQEAFIISQLRTLIPSAHAVIEETRHRKPWQYAVELKLTDPKMPLRIDNPDYLVASLLAGFHPLKAGERLLLQWVISPNATQALPVHENQETSWPFGPLYLSKDTINAQRKKFEDHTYAAVGRIAACAEDSHTAQQLAQRIFVPLNSARTHETRFKSRWVSQNMLFGRVDSGEGTVLPIVFSATELAAVIAFPIGSPSIPGLPNGRSRQLPAAQMIPREGIVAAQSNYPGDERPIAFTAESLLQHTWLLSPTGGGKSTLLHNLAAQLMEQGHGLVLIEPKGDLAAGILASVPAHRLDDVIWFDPTDVQHPIGLNVLAGDDPERTTGHVVSLMKNIYGDSWGPRLEQILSYAVKTAAMNGLTLYDVKQLLVNPDFRTKIVRATKDPDVRQFWRRLAEGPDNAVDSVVNKLDSFLGSRAIRNIIGQREGLSMAEVLDKKKILIVPLPSGQLGDANGAMLGSLIVTMFWQAVRARPVGSRKPSYLILDEFQTYLNLAVSMDDVFAIARGLGLGLMVANQHTGQLKKEVLSAVNNNARTKIAFGMAHEDAEKMKHQFPPFTAYDLQRLAQHEIVIQAMTPAGLAPPATAMTLPPPRPTGYGRLARATSRASYGRPLAEVEAELAERHQAPEKPERPKFGQRSE